MNVPWADSMTPVGPPVSARPHLRDLLYAGVVTGAWAGLLCLAIFGIGTLAGVPFDLDRPGESGLVAIPWLSVLLIPLAAAVVAALLCALVRGWPHAGRLVLVTGTAVAAVSCLVPLVQPAEVGWSTRSLLILMHVVGWALIVPQLARIVADSEPGRLVEREV